MSATLTEKNVAREKCVAAFHFDVCGVRYPNGFDILIINNILMGARA